MGSCHSREVISDKTNKKYILFWIFSVQDSGETYITKNCVTLYSYSDPLNPQSYSLQRHQEVTVLDTTSTWWRVKHGNFIGWASRYYFAPKKNREAFEAEPWYFGELSRSEAEAMLGNGANPHGAFLVRFSERRRTVVLDIKFWNGEKKKFDNKHYDVKTDQGQFWFNPEQKFSSMPDLIK